MPTPGSPPQWPACSAWPATGSGRPARAGADQGLTAITAALLGGAALNGGRGSIPGAVLGVLLLGVLDNGLVLVNADPFYSQIVVGILLVVAVGLQQSGLLERMGRSRQTEVRHDDRVTATHADRCELTRPCSRWTA